MAKKHRGKLELGWVDKGDIIVTKFDDNGKTYPASYFQDGFQKKGWKQIANNFNIQYNTVNDT